MATETTKTQPATERVTKKTLRGVVVVKSGKDTAKVRVDRYVKHPKYQKFFKKSKNYLVHDEGNAHEVGAKVVIEECAPKSKMKKFRII